MKERRNPFAEISKAEQYITCTGRRVWCSPMDRRAEKAISEAVKRGSMDAIFHAFAKIVRTHAHAGTPDNPQPLPPPTRFLDRELVDILHSIRHVSYGDEIDIIWKNPATDRDIELSGSMYQFKRKLYVSHQDDEWSRLAREINDRCDVMWERMMAIEPLDYKSRDALVEANERAREVYDSFRWMKEEWSKIPTEYAERFPEEVRLLNPIDSPRAEDLTMWMTDVTQHIQTRITEDEKVFEDKTYTELLFNHTIRRIEWPSENIEASHESASGTSEIGHLVEGMSLPQRNAIFSKLVKNLGGVTPEITTVYEQDGRYRLETISVPFVRGYFSPR